MPRLSMDALRCAVVALALAATPALAQERAPIERELEGVRKAIEFGKAAQALRDQEAAQLKSAMQELQQRLVEAAERARALDQATAEAEARLSDLMVQGEAARYRLQATEGEVAATLRAIVRLQRQPPVSLLLHHDSMVGAARGNRLLAAAVPQLHRNTAGLRQELVELAALTRKTDAERVRMNAAVAALEAQRAETSELLRQRQEQVRALAGDSSRERERLTRLAARADGLAGLLKSLVEEERRRREEAARQARLAAAERARREAEQAAEAKAQAEAQARAEAEARAEAAAKARALTPRLAFSAARGRLTLPVNGRTIRRFGDRDDVGTRTQGITLLSRAGAEVVAPHDGHIAFSGPFRDYGVILIIAHGEGYHTLLAGLAEAYVQVGQSLLAGEPVGHMGSGKNRTLYVELRRNGEAINPHSWWASNGGKVSG